MEIEFRGKAVRDEIFFNHTIHKGGWVYGYLSKIYNDSHELITVISCEVAVGEENGHPITDYISIEVDPKTVDQYTGIKDKNGKKIYYHDFVLKRTHNSPKKTCIVVYRNGGFVATEQTSDDDAYTLRDRNIEVIGNTTDNPSLYCLKLSMAKLENNPNDYWVDAPYDN